MKGYTTKAIHTKFLKNDPHGSMHMPVYDNAAFEFDSSEDIEAAFCGKKPSHMYSRITNPTVEHLEQKVKNIVDAFGVIALSSGMAAITNSIIALLKSGDNVITSKFLFGHTLSFFENTLDSWGLKVKFADFSKPETINDLIDENTRVIFLETITNPQLEVADLEKISEIAKKNNLILITDSTLTPLYFGNLKNLGVNIEVLSSTKYISGGATSIGGLIIDHGNYDWSKNEKLANDVKKFGPFAFISKLKKEVYRNLGACLSPHNAYLQSLGLETLALRVDRSCSNASSVASFLEKEPKVESVNYPGIKGSLYYETAKKQFGNNFGGLLTFNLGSKEKCFLFMNHLKLIKRATNMNDNRTLIIHPASTIFNEFSETEKERMKISYKMMRLSLGIEDVEDILDDIKQALEVIK